ncbi:unnamed protein product, partial [marine sediment metagenome]
TLFNGNYGVSCAGGSGVMGGNLVTSNSVNGIHCTAGGCVISGNVVMENGSYGIYVVTNNLITNNLIKGNGSYGVYCGGKGVPQTIVDCRITDNGHGMYIRFSSPRCRRTAITNNTGRGMYWYWYNTSGSMSPRFEDCVISDNGDDGLLTYLYWPSWSPGNCYPEFTRCQIVSNGGHGVFIDTVAYSTVHPVFSNTVVAWNREHGIYIETVNDLLVSHCTIASNSLAGSYYGLYYTIYNAGYLRKVEDSIVYFHPNSIGAGSDLMTLNVVYSDVEGGPPAGGLSEGCIDADPQFVDLPNRDVHLPYGSPCINPGDGHTEMGVYGKEELAINDGDPVTGDPVVQLGLEDTAPSWDGTAVVIRLSNDGSNWCVQAFTNSVVWDLAADLYGGDGSYGSKTVYYMALDSASNALSGEAGATVVTERIEFVLPTVRIVPHDPVY